AARRRALDQHVRAELVGQRAEHVAAQPQRDRARRVRLAAGRDHLADLEAAPLGELLEAQRELGDEPAGVGGADPGRDEQIVIGHSFTVAIGVRAATRVAWPWLSSAAITGSIAL